MSAPLMERIAVIGNAGDIGAVARGAAWPASYRDRRFPLWRDGWQPAPEDEYEARHAIAHPPAGAKEMPPTEALFHTIFEVDRD